MGWLLALGMVAVVAIAAGALTARETFTRVLGLLLAAGLVWVLVLARVAELRIAAR